MRTMLTAAVSACALAALLAPASAEAPPKEDEPTVSAESARGFPRLMPEIEFLTLDTPTDDAWHKLFVKEIKAMKSKMAALEAENAALRAELENHRHDYQDFFMGGGLWLTVEQLRKLPSSGNYGYDDYGVYFRSAPLPPASSGAFDKTTGPAKP